MVYDFVMLGILVFTTVRGSAKGMAWQLAAIASLVLCFLFATPLSLTVAPYINVEPPLNRWIGMLGIYLVFSFGCFSIARMLRSWLEAARFEEYDKHLGALFGFVKGATFCFVVTFFVVCLSQQACQYVLHTNSGYLAATVMQQLEVVMPAELGKVLAPYVHRLDGAGSSALADWERRPESAPSELPSRSGNDRPELPPESPDFRGSTRPDDAADFDNRSPVRNDNRADRDEAPRDPSAEQPPAIAKWMNRLSDLLSSDLKEHVLGTLRDHAASSGSSAGNQNGTAPGGAVSRNGNRTELPPAADLATERQRLEHDISAMLSGRPEQQAAARAEIEAALRDVPAGVGAAALRDWYADLLGKNPDPDPETDVTTSLGERLRRQAEWAGEARR